MADDNKGTIFLTLVLDTLHFRQYFETYTDNEEGPDRQTPLDGAFRKALVDGFREPLLDLDIDLQVLGYEVIEEFYTDQVLSDDGYELRLSGDYSENSSEVGQLRDAFEEKAGAFIADLPALISSLENASIE